jgi:aspartate/methionine/tyrosine aminotransferase
MPYHETLNPFSARTAWDLAESPYAAAVRELRASGRPLYDLTLSNPTRCGFTYDTAGILAPLANPQSLAYDPDPIGILSAREAVARYYADHGAHIDPAQILLTTSTSESYSFLFRLLCDPGDEVLVAQPSYPLFDFLADLDDVVLKPYPLFYDHGWSIDLDALERAITPRTRAILVVHPNNPTGHWTTPTERHHLQHLCARHNVALIVDEVFLDYPLASPPATPNPQPATSFSTADHAALTFILSGLSKVAALPQMKVAWLLTLGPDPARTNALARLEVIADTFLSMNAPAQLALPSWLASRHHLQTQIRARTCENLATLTRLAAEHPGRLQLLRAEAGWSAVLNLPACVGEPACAERLVRERGVILHPGSFYAMPEPTRLVVSLIVPTHTFASSMQRAIT